MIYVSATFRIKPGTLEAFVEAAYVLIDSARRELGCIYYDLHASVTDPDRVVCLEQWADRAALDTHLASAHTLAFGKSVEPLVASSRIEIPITSKRSDPNSAACSNDHRAAIQPELTPCYPSALPPP